MHATVRHVNPSLMSFAKAGKVGCEVMFPKVSHPETDLTQRSVTSVT